MTKQLCESCKGLGCLTCGGEGHVAVSPESPSDALATNLSEYFSTALQHHFDTSPSIVRGDGAERPQIPFSSKARRFQAFDRLLDEGLSFPTRRKPTIIGLISKLTAAGYSVEFSQSADHYAVRMVLSRNGGFRVLHLSREQIHRGLTPDDFLLHELRVAVRLLPDVDCAPDAPPA